MSLTAASRCPRRYLVFHSYQFHDESGVPYYECIDFVQARLPQTILAYEMNGEPLPVEHGAPLRLRLELKLGFKMVKFLRAIEVVDDYRKIGRGMGGVREDQQQYDMGAEIDPTRPAIRIGQKRLRWHLIGRVISMSHDFKVGDHVEWNSEAGRVRGTIRKRVMSEIKFKGYTVRASRDDPQYLIESDKTDHLARHKGSALKKVRSCAAGPKKSSRLKA